MQTIPKMPFVSSVAQQIVDQARNERIPIENLVQRFTSELRHELHRIHRDYRHEPKSHRKADKDKFVIWTKREREVIELLCQGMCSNDISYQLKVSSNNISTLRARIAAKLDIATRDVVSISKRVEMHGIDSIPDPHAPPPPMVRAKF